MSLMSERRSMLSLRNVRSIRDTGITRRRVASQSQRTVIPRGTILARMPDVSMRRSGVSMLTRPVVSMLTRPGVSMRTRPGVSIPTRPGINIRSFIPTVGATAPLSAQPGGGLPTPSVSGGGLSLGGIGGDLQAFGGNIVDQFKNLMPIAIKIIVAVVIIKIVLWLVRGRRR